MSNTAAKAELPTELPRVTYTLELSPEPDREADVDDVHERPTVPSLTVSCADRRRARADLEVETPLRPISVRGVLAASPPRRPARSGAQLIPQRRPKIRKVVDDRSGGGVFEGYDGWEDRGVETSLAEELLDERLHAFWLGERRRWLSRWVFFAVMIALAMTVIAFLLAG